MVISSFAALIVKTLKNSGFLDSTLGAQHESTRGRSASGIGTRYGPIDTKLRRFATRIRHGIDKSATTERKAVRQPGKGRQF
jgi:hypothetical protein